MNERRVRTPKASERQKEELIKYFENNTQALRTLNGTDNRAKQRIWLELTHKLNSIDGALKSTMKWAKYWNDIVIYTRTRAKSFITGECRCDRPPTEIEQRILTVIGHTESLKAWQHVWDSSVEKPPLHTTTTTILKQEVLDSNVVEDQSHTSSAEEFELAEYEAMVMESQDASMTTLHIIPSSSSSSNNQMQLPLKTTMSKEEAEPTDSCYSEAVQLVEHLDEKDANDDNGTSSKNGEGFMEELSENVRTLANSFNTIGTALHNIASLLERYK